MTDIGSIRAFLTADSSDYDQKLDGAARQAESFSKKAQRSFDKVGKGLSSLGKSLTIGLTLPLAAAGAGFIKLASDAEETAQKFDVVFASVSSSANEMADSLAQSFGFASDESRTLLGTTGDLLTGFGFSQEAALDLAFEVNTLAADLASFSNIEGGSARASEALTKALLGETEQAKALGVVIRQDSDEFRDLVTHGMEVEGMTLLQSKAIASLTIATNQSKNAIGDFARTQDSFANQMRIMSAEARDLAVAFGKQLLPIAKDMVTWARDITEAFGELTPQTQRLVIVVAGFAAAAGPLAFIAGQLISGFGLLIGLAGTLGTVIAAAAGPVILLVAGLGLLWTVFSDLIDLEGPLNGFWNGLVKSWTAVTNFFGDVSKFIQDENASIAESSKVNIQLAGKAWLTFNAVFETISGTLKGAVQSVLLLAQGLLQLGKLTGKVFGSDIVKTIEAAQDRLDDWIITLEASKVANANALAQIAEDWGDADTVLRGVLNSMSSTFSALPEEIANKLRQNFPTVFAVIDEMMAKIRGFVEGAEPIQIPIRMPVGADKFGGIEEEEGEDPFAAFNEGLSAARNRLSLFRKLQKDALKPDTMSIAAAWKNIGSIYSNFFSQLSGLYAKGTAEQKIFAAASIIIDTATAIMKVFATVPYPYSIVAAAGVAAIGAVQLAKVGSGGGESSEPLSAAGTETAILPQALQSNVIGDPETENLGAFDRAQKLVLSMTDEMGTEFMSWVVDKADDGKGNGVQTLALRGT